MDLNNRIMKTHPPSPSETYICGHLSSLQLWICSPNHWVLLTGVGFNCWLLSSASRAAGVFGGQALHGFGVSCHCVIDVVLLSMLYKVNSNSNHCLLCEIPSASTRVRHPKGAAVVRPLEFELSRCRTSQFARRLMPRIVFSSVCRGAGACGVAKEIYKLCFFRLCLCGWFS